jgi:type IV fimbrial biogenesis protein FimT
MKARPSQGFTLVELMVAIAVFAILIGIAVPSFRETLQNGKVASQTNGLVVALTLARSEANKRGQAVTICAAADRNQEQCAAVDASSWEFGWLVFTDRQNAGAVDVDETVIFKSEIVPKDFRVSTASIGFVRFAPSGAPTNGINIILGLQPSACSNDRRREVTVYTVGRINTAKKACV